MITRNEQSSYVKRIEKDYAGAYKTMNWLNSPETVKTATEAREELISAIFGRSGSSAAWEFAGTKPYTHGLSPGCALCGQGKWSCLFINNICNARCFYCPSEQNDRGLPMTSTVTFEKALDYVLYVNRFGIEGVGFSGGEPLMTLDRVLDYLNTLGNHACRPIYTWMYTNGILATKDKFKALRDNGLKEIRFDLSADNYNLSGLEKAVGIIPVVTVEIPAVPEDLEITKPLTAVLSAMGVKYLNLHQIRCTQFNRPKLIRRGYTFIHGPDVAVLETELAALELIRHTLDRNIPLPVNYCSFTFRNQFQKAAARHRNARLVKKDWEEITPTGFIRAMSITGPPERLGPVLDRFRCQEDGKWEVSAKQDRISFHSRLWPLIDFTGLELKIRYNATALRPAATLRYPFTKIRLNQDKAVVIERDDRHPGIRLKGDEIPAFARQFLMPSGTGADPTGLSLEQEQTAFRFECFDQGLAPLY
ncbi:radical SAM protein [Desulfobacter latus]|uniref:Radical SAM protein n=1 Tax=Desulfobacter latus TaxID=2292 RepID=A0A850TBT4_9BACT|nr:radical SAM protein [Desulfobacter latus]NWH05697.1 radical SAM protein [Desulfobacter latus]